jgi:hypothetical protein
MSFNYGLAGIADDVMFGKGGPRLRATPSGFQALSPSGVPEDVMAWRMMSLASQGVAPLSVLSSTMVDNLNVEYLSGVPANGFTLRNPSLLVVGPSGSNADYVCDGTGDQEQFNAAYAALPPEGGTILVRSGSYSFSAEFNPATIGKPLKLVGSSWVSTIINSGHNLALHMGSDGSSVSNLKFVMTASGSTALYFGAPVMSVEDCWFVNTTDTGYGVVAGFHNHTIKNNIFGQDGVGIPAYGVATVDGGSNLLIEHNYFSYTSKAAIHFQRNYGGRNSIVRSNYIWAVKGLLCDSSVETAGAAPYSVSVTDNLFRCLQCGIDFDNVNTVTPTGASGLEIHGNSFENDSDSIAHIRLRGVSNASITGNSFGYPKAGCLALIYIGVTTNGGLNCDKVAITGNTGTASPAAYAVQEYDASQNGTIVSGNKFSAGASGLYSLLGPTSVNFENSLIGPASTTDRAIVVADGITGLSVAGFDTDKAPTISPSGRITSPGGFTSPGTGPLLYNEFYGANCGNSSLTSNNNVGLGADVLSALTTGFANTAAGYQSMLVNDTGSRNAAFGAISLMSNISGGWLTAMGTGSLAYNTTGSFNTGCGVYSLINNTVGEHNTGCGYLAGSNSVEADFNTSLGSNAGSMNRDGSGSTCLGAYSLMDHASNTQGNSSYQYLSTLGYNTTLIAPSRPATSLQSGGSATIGDHYYIITYVIDGVEFASPVRKRTVTTIGTQTVRLTGLSTYDGPQSNTAKYVYKTLVSGYPAGYPYTYYRIASLSLSATTFDDTISDATILADPITYPVYDSVQLENSISLGSNGTITKSNCCIIGDTRNPITDLYLGGICPNTKTDGQNFTIHGMGGYGENVIGGSLYLAAGQGTGSSVGGNIVFQTTSIPDAPITSKWNALIDRVTIDGTTGLTNIMYGITSGRGTKENEFFGYNCGLNIDAGVYNTAIGSYSQYLVAKNSFNTSIGFESLYNNSNGNYCLALGSYAGKYCDSDYEFFVNVFDRGDYLGDQKKSLIYGVSAADHENQILRFNANCTMNGNNIFQIVDLYAEPTPTTSGRKGNIGYYNGYIYLWKADSEVVSWVVRATW